jgi:hypothetical protein
MLKGSFNQDRLGTNIQKTQKWTCADVIWRKAGSSVSQALTSSLGIIGQGISGQESAYDPSGLEEILKEKSAVAVPMAAGQDSRGGKHAFSEPV